MLAHARSFALALALVATTGLASRASATVATPRGASTPLQAVAALVTPFYDSAVERAARRDGGCDPVTGALAACPLTPRLRARLPIDEAMRYSANPICRCQNPARTVRLAQIYDDGRAAYIITRWFYGPADPGPGDHAYRITFALVRQPDGWDVDDTYCTGQARTTNLYLSSVGPCP